MADHFYDTWKRAQLGGTGGGIDFDTDPLFMMLVNATYQGLSTATRRAHDFRDDADQDEITATGYTAGGVQLTSVSIVSDGTNGYKITCSNPAWASFTGSAYGAVLFKRVGADMSTPADDPLIAFWDFVTVQSASNGTFTLTVPAGGLLSLP